MIAKLKVFLKEKIPFLQRWYEKWRYRENLKLSSEEIFTKIYHTNYWKDKESVSGQGSNSIQTQQLSEELPVLFRQLKITSVLDAPCGDFNWMKSLLVDIRNYYGVDIVKELVEQNKEKYAGPGIEFIHGDLTRDTLPAADLILVRDLFIHFSDDDVFRTLENLKKINAKYLLTTTFINRKHNYNIHTGSWRPINLQIPPFNFPDPILILNENCSEHNNQYADKALGLWKFSQLER